MPAKLAAHDYADPVSIQQEQLTLTPQQKRKKVKSLTEKFIICRTKGHWWKDLDAIEEKAQCTEVNECRRCGLNRVRVYSWSGYLIAGPFYSKYPDGYLLEGFGHLTEDDNALVRTRWLREKSIRKSYNEEIHE